ncbi:hypothetical protein TPB0596_46200 [Tsukamurella pulmonis]|uniref:Uncharacterized protein n=1 Tax=Tsukamurella pulmonis TaxID=47312 RepID=A0A1H1AJN2_9ACTN|nr:hypothetical protein [Tsukamurella pulmonis]KXO96012.1 hypothetical protein AXK56_00215 [Tsukamurella pulmonis]KXP08298.1 hypothetical protein AXK57_17730 [Tsukamurella pulmonis]RDH10199.1 hypothetical protein DVB88_18905 [Tsukamurella pulmonis]SDQ39879.1 hypothetical protein SAMN04489765_0256 [Tsukamurella pulmonis]SUP26537.1 Uncharacterised protein [Tsukamurella pulmonis]
MFGLGEPLRGHRRLRTVLGVLLATAVVVHLARALAIPMSSYKTTCIGLALAYGVILLMVLVGERWGYTAAAVFPLTAVVLGDYCGAIRAGSLNTVDVVVDLAIVPAAIMMLRAHPRPEPAAA